MFEEKIHNKKNVEALAKKVVMGAEYLLHVLPKSFNVEEVFIHLIEGCC